MTIRTVSLRTEGHLIDTGLLSRYLALVVENGATYELRHFEIGRSVEDFSKLWFTVAGDAERPRASRGRPREPGLHRRGQRNR